MLKNPKNYLFLLNYHRQLRPQHILPLRLSHLKKWNSSRSTELLQELPLVKRNLEQIKDGTIFFQHYQPRMASSLILDFNSTTSFTSSQSRFSCS